MALFASKILDAALRAHAWRPSPEQAAAAARWAELIRGGLLYAESESAAEAQFQHTVVEQLLGYRPFEAGDDQTVAAKEPVGAGVADLALGRFRAHGREIVAPFELKGPNVRLDAIMSGRHKTPVQQAWEYANDAVGARWVLVSNMVELRLYAVGRGRANYERFDLSKLDDPAELRRLHLVVSAESMLGETTVALLERTLAEDKAVTNQLYAEYKAIRGALLEHVRTTRLDVDGEARIEVVQKVLDRVLFIAFAEDSALLPHESLRRAVHFSDPYSEPRSKWFYLRRLFQAVDRGEPRLGIPPYNGGLFAPDPLLDALELPDPLCDRLGALSSYDYKSSISVNILGHIFEQSITDLERERAVARGEPPPTTTKRKREGVVYTPDFVTRFIVERTIGAHLAEVSARLLAEHATGVDEDGLVRWRGRHSERAYFEAYFDALRSIRIADPACGSGAFLVAAFDWLHAEHERVRERLVDLGADLFSVPNSDTEIVTRNLFGVDVSPESVEIAKLSLWLKTAKRHRKLESLDQSIKCGNSLVNDPAVHTRPFDWQAEFGAILGGAADSGFDIVLGNPPYVRMELLKAIKPHLQSRYAVAADRADLYAYFFELSVGLLKPGGRLGFISSSSFFRTGSGAPLRKFLSNCTAIETVVDFGDLPVFEGVTTYPAIITLRADSHASGTESLSYLNVRAIPDDLSRTFEDQALHMPRERLTSSTWRFEGDLLDTIRVKMATGRPTLAEVLGPPLYGIKTGLNDAFVLTRAQHDRLAERAQHHGDRSMDLLKPFLIGENLKRWRVESDDLWLIYTPRDRIDIDEYPALREHLEPYRDRLEARATRQKWWELQQAQAAYEPHFEARKLVWPHFQSRGSFSVEPSPSYLNNKCFFWPNADIGLAAYLNSDLSWFLLVSSARVKRGGYIEAEAQYVGALPSLDAGFTSLHQLGSSAASAQFELSALGNRVMHRLADLHPEIGKSPAFTSWSSFTFADLQARLLKHFRTEISVDDRDEWEGWFDARKAEAAAHEGRIADAEGAINERVYAAFQLTSTEIHAVEDALALASPALSVRAYEAISAVEGLTLSPESRKRLAKSAPRGRSSTRVA